MDLGTYKLKCIKPDGVVLTKYANFAMTNGQIIDLMDQALPDTIKCMDWYTADNMCRDPGFQIAQKILAGEILCVEARGPDLSGTAN